MDVQEKIHPLFQLCQRFSNFQEYYVFSILSCEPLRRASHGQSWNMFRKKRIVVHVPPFENPWISSSSSLAFPTKFIQWVKFRVKISVIVVSNVQSILRYHVMILTIPSWTTKFNCSLYLVTNPTAQRFWYVYFVHKKYTPSGFENKKWYENHMCRSRDLAMMPRELRSENLLSALLFAFFVLFRKNW